MTMAGTSWINMEEAPVGDKMDQRVGPVELMMPNGIIEMATWESFHTVAGGTGWAWVTRDHRTIGFYDPVGWRPAAIAN
jgi:hypothetical protein